MKKYLVDNLPNQSITGDLSISGNLDISGTITGGPVGPTGPVGPIGATGPVGPIGATGPGITYKTYRALLTETTPVTGDNILYFNLALIVGETYTINTYASGDDFSNIADVISGTANESGCVFVATGGSPADWSNGSELQSGGGLVVTELENTLGFDVAWSSTVDDGIYAGFDPSEVASFPREKTSVSVGIKTNFWGENFAAPFCEIATGGYTDDVVILSMIDISTGYGYAGSLYYTPVTINMNL